MDGTQARLKQSLVDSSRASVSCGKGGWDSGEIETVRMQKLPDNPNKVWKGWMGLRRD